MAVSPDVETVKLPRPPPARPFHQPNKAVHALADLRDESIDLVLLCLDLDAYPSVRQILHMASHIEFARYVQHSVAKANPLDMAGENGAFVMDFAGRWHGDQLTDNGYFCNQ